MIGLRKNLHRAMAVLVAAIMACSAAAQDGEPPRLNTNEATIAELARSHRLPIDDPMAVFGYVLGSLPERVKVYPTENHYYFSFDLNGVRYAGNIKIDARLRAEGKVVFSYYQDRPAWLPDADGPAVILGPSQGATVEKVEPLAYRVSYGNKSVVFALNDLSQVRPPAAVLAPDDQFIGPIFDESGIRFFLVFNKKLKIFHYILDETVKPADVFVPAPVGDGRILIGTRTGFALYRDQKRDRKILIGVYRDNVLANNYLDGPFDQMPDNFIEGDTLQQALIAAEPKLKGRINRYGSFADDSRFAITPYMEYRSPNDLAIFDRCATDRRIAADRYAACFALPLEGNHDAKAQPLALRQRTR
jgi:hypothetical protein